MTRALLALVLLLSGCSTCSVHPDLLADVRGFLKATSHLPTPPGFNHMCSVDYSDNLGGNTLGLCVQYPTGHNDVYIKRGLSPAAQRWVVWHELGHCLWLLDHDHSEASLMRAEVSQDDLTEPWAVTKQTFLEYLTREAGVDKIKKDR